MKQSELKSSCAFLIPDNKISEVSFLKSIDVIVNPKSFAEFSFVLELTEDGFALKTLKDNKLKPFTIDLINAMKNQRRGKKDFLARAVGVGKIFPLEVWDLTAGLLGDACFLASLGCKVKAYERSPIIYAFVREAYERASKKSDAPDWMKENLSIELCDGKEILKKSLSDSVRPTTIYLDPMYPDEGKTALSRKEMQLFREIAGSDTDTQELFDLAMASQTSRVVLKRPLKAPYLREGANFSYRSNSIRFDLYVQN